MSSSPQAGPKAVVLLESHHNHISFSHPRRSGCKSSCFLNAPSSLDQIHQTVRVPYAGNRPVFPAVLERLPVGGGRQPHRSVLRGRSKLLCGCVRPTTCPSQPQWVSRVLVQLCVTVSPAWVGTLRRKTNNSSILYTTA